MVTDVERRNTASAELMRRNGFTDQATVRLFVRPLADSSRTGAAAPRRHLTSAAAERVR